MKDTKRYEGLDSFRIVCAVLVIMIHTQPFTCINDYVDLTITRIIARIAVPFFIMVTGFFVMPSEQNPHSPEKKLAFTRFIKKLLCYYLIAVVLYLPLNWYTGAFQEGFHPVAIAKALFFEGTFYHLWYFPALLLGGTLVYLLSKKMSFGSLFFTSCLLYLIGLLGDSYYGMIAKSPILSSGYDALFSFCSYTRNGLFYVPLFLVLGILLRNLSDTKTLPSRTGSIIGTLFCMTWMIAEGLLLHTSDIPRHDSMYLFLPPLMYFLFSLLLRIPVAGNAYLRQLTLPVYILHPLMIVVVRLIGKLTHTEFLLIDQSLLHFLAVTCLTFLVSFLFMSLFHRTNAESVAKSRAWVEISKENLIHNVTELKTLLPKGTSFMAVVKANAYGHGAVEISRILNRQGIYHFAVATAQEGVELRKHHIKGTILVLGYTPPNQASLLHRYHLTQTVTDYQYALALDSSGYSIPVHIKVDTGMHRLGQDYHDIEQIKCIYNLKHLHVDGIFSHLCVADSLEEEDVDFTYEQIHHFDTVLEALRHAGINPGKTHIQSSYGVLNYPELGYDFARIGIAMYGVLSSNQDETKMVTDLRPVLSIKARISAIKVVHANESVGYGRQYIADHDARIAVLTIGYADGIPRDLSCGNGEVLINGQQASIIGRICMDQMMVDITGLRDIHVNDIATIVGHEKALTIRAEDVTQEAGTITNELLSRIGARLERFTV